MTALEPVSVANRPVVLLFPGQGGQYLGMGQRLFETEPVFRDVLFQASRIVRTAGGVDLIETLFDGTVDWRDDLEVSHPAIVAMQWGIVAALRAKGAKVAAVMGASLGEYSAMATAGATGFADMVRLAFDHARLALAHTNAGGLVAALGPDATLQTLVEPGVTIAGVNAPDHVIFAGEDAALDRLIGRAQAAGCTTVRLPVPRPFHAPEMAPLADAHRQSMTGLRLGAPDLPCYSATARGRLRQTDARHFWNLVRDPLYVPEALQALQADHPGCLFVEVGPGAGLVNTLRRQSRAAGHKPETFTVLNPMQAAEAEALPELGDAARSDPGRMERLS